MIPWGPASSLVLAYTTSVSATVPLVHLHTTSEGALAVSPFTMQGYHAPGDASAWAVSHKGGALGELGLQLLGASCC